MSTLMLCGSPHNEGGNSTYFLKGLKEKLNGKGDIYNIMHSSEISEAAFLQGRVWQSAREEWYTRRLSAKDLWQRSIRHLNKWQMI